jgi:hypothetical protein
MYIAALRVDDREPAGMDTALLAYSGISVKIVVDRGLGAELLAMFMVDYEPGGAAQAHDHPFEEAYFFLDGEIAANSTAWVSTPGPAWARPDRRTGEQYFYRTGRGISLPVPWPAPARGRIGFHRSPSGATAAGPSRWQDACPDPWPRRAHRCRPHRTLLTSRQITAICYN